MARDGHHRSTDRIKKLDVHGWHIDQGPSDWVDVRGSFLFWSLKCLGFWVQPIRPAMSVSPGS